MGSTRPPLTHTLAVKNEIREVGRAVDALREFWALGALPEEFEVPVAICLEEVLSNVIRHGCPPGSDCDIQVHYRVLTGAAEGIEVEVSDNATAFDPFSLPEPNITAPLEQRRPGGLGVFLVRKMMDEARYERRTGRNHFVFRKRWNSEPGG